MDNAIIDLHIKEYLDRNNYQSTLLSFKKEAKIYSASTQQPDLERFTKAFIHETNKFPSSSEQFFQSFLLVNSFVNMSMEQYKSELKEILYPLFAYLHIYLIIYDHFKDAELFLNTYKPMFESTQSEEIMRLQLLHNKSFSKSSTIAEYVQNKYIVTMSPYAQDLLMHFVAMNKLKLVSQIINLHILFNVNNEPVLNNKTIRSCQVWNHSKKMPINTSSYMYEAVMSQENKTKMQMSSLNYSHEIDSNYEIMLEELCFRAKLSEKCLPSIAFHALINAQSAICIEISRDASIIACGFEDGSIMLFIQNPDFQHNLESEYDKAGNKIKRGDDPSKSKEKKRRKDIFTNESDTVDYITHISNTLIGHSGPVFSISINPNNQFMLSASYDKTIRLWSIQLKRTITIFNADTSPVWKVQFNPFGYYFATSSADCTAKLWCTSSMQPLRIFVGHLKDIDMIEFHPNIENIATASADKTIKIWSIEQGNCLSTLLGVDGTCTCLKFSTEGKHLLSSYSSGVLLIYDLKSWATLECIDFGKGRINSFDISSEDSIVAIGYEDSLLQLINIKKILERKLHHSAEDYLIKEYQAKYSALVSVKFTYRNVLLCVGKIKK